jgi:hypothetical protein
VSDWSSFGKDKKIMDSWKSFLNEATVLPTGADTLPQSAHSILSKLAGNDTSPTPPAPGRADFRPTPEEVALVNKFLELFDLDMPSWEDVESKYNELKQKVSDNAWPIAQEILFEALIKKFVFKGMKLPRGKSLLDILKDPNVAIEILKAATDEAYERGILKKQEEFQNLFNNLGVQTTAETDDQIEEKIDSLWEIFPSNVKEEIVDKMQDMESMNSEQKYYFSALIFNLEQ